MALTVKVFIQGNLSGSVNCPSSDLVPDAIGAIFYNNSQAAPEHFAVRFEDETGNGGWMLVGGAEAIEDVPIKSQVQ